MVGGNSICLAFILRKGHCLESLAAIFLFKNSLCYTSPKQCFQFLDSSAYLGETCCFAGRKVHHYPLEFDKID